MPQDEYAHDFGVANDKVKLQSAFDQVTDIRKFEIGLYWTRATYFWALIAVAFGGYFALFSADKFSNQFLLTMLVGTVGFVFTFAWYLANRGSKYWQENWENHLDMLEDQITGPLYKTVLRRPNATRFDERYVTGPLSISVSKINQWVSLYVMFVWMILVALASAKALSQFELTLFTRLLAGEPWLSVALQIVIIGGAVGCCLLMFFLGRSHKGEHKLLLIKRETRITGRA